MPLDPSAVADLVVPFWPRRFVRVTALARSATPLGMGFGDTRFASPTKAFRLLYIAKNIRTGIAETIVRDRFEGATTRELMMTEVLAWGATEISTTSPLNLLDVRMDGCVALGVSTDIKGAKGQDEARQFSQEVHESTDLDGILYKSRLTGEVCAAIYERAVNSKLQATPVVELSTLRGLVPALRRLKIRLIR